MTRIEWTRNSDGTSGKTWNPIVGCSIVSPGCTNCYAMTMAARLEVMSRTQFPQYAGTTKRVNGNAVWTGKVARAPEATLLKPLSVKKPTTWFVNSMGDLFHEDTPRDWQEAVFAVMALTPHHTYQVLTKRSGLMMDFINHADEDDTRDAMATEAARLTGSATAAADVIGAGWPLKNVWIGVSAERQQEANARILDLLATRVAVRFVSAEPLLGPIDFGALPIKGGSRTQIKNALTGERNLSADHLCGLERLDWVIVGGESGPSARPMHPDWARSIRDQCAAASVPFFFKQWGEWAPYDSGAIDSAKLATPKSLDTPMQRFGKSRAGRLLDGRLHDAMPVAALREVVP